MAAERFDPATCDEQTFVERIRQRLHVERAQRLWTEGQVELPPDKQIVLVYRPAMQTDWEYAPTSDLPALQWLAYREEGKWWWPDGLPADGITHWALLPCCPDGSPAPNVFPHEGGD